jgi:type I restriction enzyme, R subunit
LNYFKPATQLGLTATPKRTDNADTYAYFGEPVYTYSLREGIEDGYLTPFRVRQYSSTIDTYQFDGADKVLAGAPDEDAVYEEKNFNRSIQIVLRDAGPCRAAP